MASSGARQRPSSRNVVRALIAAAFAAAAPSHSALACTSFLIRTSDGGAVYGRTMEFAIPLESSAIVIPRQYALTASSSSSKPSMSWKAKYAAVGINALGETALVDGMNEKGLAGGVLYFPDYAGYADPTKVDPQRSLAPWDLLTWALTNFSTVAEVKAALSGISIVNVKHEKLGFTPPLHYTLHDASGASLVVEPVDGTLKVYDNPLGVMTNSPSLDWHLTNLKNYVKLSPANAAPLTIDGENFAPTGQGSGLIGLPGDPTPPSRFLRALSYTLTVEKKPSGIESVRLVEHILNNFDIPAGWIRDQKGSQPAEMPLEYTQWSTVADLTSKTFYVKTYDNQVLRGIDLSSFDLDAKTLLNAPLDPGGAPPSLVFSK